MKDIVEFTDWEKLDLRVGQIVKVEEIEGADKLYKLTINLGSEIGKRVVCAGIKPYYDKDSLKNKKIILFANLQPRTLRGIESQGMILASSSDKEGDNQVALLTLDKEVDIENGAKVS
jgi:methionyl-tRNA synthetase